jgi:CheY-like chemotaxis protein
LLPCHIDAVVVTSGLHAIRKLERGSFDLVVADLEMPGLSGADLLLIVKERWPASRRILLTGHTSGHLLERAAAYADAVLDKILSREIISETICRLAIEPRKP